MGRTWVLEGSIGQRAFWSAVESLLLVAFAGYWFGNTGVGLAVLWLVVPGQGWAVLATNPRATPAEILPRLQPLLVSPQRLLLRAEDGRRVEIYADEVTASEWAALKRRALAGQLATGRSTSI